MNLIEKISNLISFDQVSQLSQNTQETSFNLEKGIKALVPTILTALSSKSNDDLGGILGHVKDAFSNVSSTGAPTNKNFGGVLRSIFGDKTDTVLSSVASYAGLKESSMHQVANTASNGIFDGLKQISPSLDLSTLKSVLADNAGSFKDMIPAGLGSLAGLFGAGSLGNLGTAFEPKAQTPKVDPVTPPRPQASRPVTPPPSNHTHDGHVSDNKGGSPWKYIIPILIILGLLYFFFVRGCNRETVETVETVDTIRTEEPMVQDQPIEVKEETRESLVVTLPNGENLNAYKGGIEDKLVQFLNSDYKSKSKEELKAIWFDFDNLNFETGSANVVPESKTQLDNIVAILKAYPNTKIKIGGYTDKTGNEAANKKLSNERALSVKKHIEAAGNGAQVDGAEGYGSEFAKAAADAPETERILDRHVSVSVR